MIDKQQSVLEHLTELRRRIIYSVVALLVAITGCMFFSHRIFIYILSTATSDPKTPLIIVQNVMADAFLTEFHLAVIAAIVIAFPVILYQLVAFVLPALRESEKRLLYLGLPFATAMFLAGWSFGWFIVVPLTKSFFLGLSSSAGILNHITPNAYISFILGICNPLGIAFELPLVVLILARIGLVSATFLSRIRKYAFLGIMVLAAILSPPDVISLTIFLIPLYGLYEFSIILARFGGKKKE